MWQHRLSCLWTGPKRGAGHLLKLDQIPLCDRYRPACPDIPDRDGLKIEQRVAESYDAVARDYAANIVGVERKPLDLAFLDQFVDCWRVAALCWTLDAVPAT